MAMNIINILLSFSIIGIAVYCVAPYLRRLSINYVSAYFLITFIFVVPGSLIILCGYTEGFYFTKQLTIDRFYGTLYFLAISYSYAMVFITLTFVIQLFGIKNSIIEYGVKGNKREMRRYSLPLLLLIQACFVIYYFNSIHPSPLYLSFIGVDPLEVAIRRIEVTKDLKLIANQYIISIGKYFLWVTSYIAFQYRSFAYHEKILSLASIFFTMLYLLLGGEKAYILLYLIGLWSLSFWRKQSTPKVTIFPILLVACSIFFVYSLIVSDDINEIFDLVVERIFIAQIASVYYSFIAYPAYGELGFSTIGGALGFILGNYNPTPASTQLMHNYFFEMIAVGGWNINGFFLHESWANFGLFGLILAPLLIGVLAALPAWFIISSSKSPVTVAVYAFSCVYVIPFITSMNSYFYNTDLIVPGLFLLLNSLLTKSTKHEKNSL